MGTLSSPQFIPWVWAYTPILLIGHDDPFKVLSVKSLVSSIDLISSLGKYSLILSHLDLKSTPNHGNSIPLPTATVVRVDGNFHEFPWVWRLSVQLEIICAGHTP